MVIDDAPLTALTPERMRAVVTPKAHGAWLLHEATREMKLDCFVMFSSVSSIFGNPAQGNYSAANAFLDSLAHHRQALGLPALTVNWGVLGGEGYVARNERVAEFLARQGTTGISPGEAMTLLESFLRAGSTQTIAIRVDWAKWRQFFRGMQENPLFERIFTSIENQESDGATSDWRSRIEAAGPAEKQAVIRRSRARSRRLGAARQTGQPARRSAADRSRARFAHGRRNRERRSKRQSASRCRRRA